MPLAASAKVLSTCMACGCLCDDIEVVADGTKIIRAGNACVLGKQWYLTPRRSGLPQATVDGKPAEFRTALVRAAELLNAAKYPLIYGLAHASTQAQRLAVSLASRLRGCLDVEDTDGLAAVERAMQDVGQATCTLGEVKNRADLIVFWAADPAATHPRHGGRYSITPTGLFTPRGRADRGLVVVDSRRTSTAAQADLFVPLVAGGHFETLQCLRAYLRVLAPDKPSAAFELTSAEALTDLASRLQRCKYGVIFFGKELASAGRHALEALFALVGEVRNHTPCAALALGPPGNAAGAMQVLTWLTGYPFAVSFHRGYPVFGPDEFRAADVLGRADTDAALVIASDPLGHLPPSACDRLRSIPVVVVDAHETATSRSAAVWLKTAAFGLDADGTAHRIDGVCLPVARVLAPDCRSAKEVLTLVLGQLGALASELVPGWDT